MDDKTAQTLRLEDGRRLGYAEYGDPEGKPLFWFHGFPDSRLEAQFADEAARAMGVRIVSLDRPGYGLSDYKSGRKVADWPSDVAEVADTLGFEHFAVLGLSGGGPYAAACASRLPDRVSAAAFVSGLGPTDVKESVKGYPWYTRLGFRSYRWFPWNARIGMFWVGYALRRWPEKAWARTLKNVCPADREILSRPELREGFQQVTREAFRQGSRATAHDLILYSKSWGFREEDIKIPVHVWHGDADTIVPFSMGLYQAKAVPNSSAHFFKAEGHFLVVDRVSEILQTLLADVRMPAASASA